jgi:phosphate-selective porin OprO and OprP
MALARSPNVLRPTSTSLAVVVFALLGALSASAQQPPTDQPDRDRKDGWRFRWADHPQIESRNFRLEFRGQLHGVNVDSDGPIRRNEGEAFDIARRRVGIDGEFAGRVSFQAEAELERDDPVRDLYVNYRLARALQVRGGRFKLPFGLEENTPHARLEFVQRSLMSNRLAPGRDDGVMLHGRTGRVSYQTGVFLHDGANARARRATRVFGDRTVVGRVMVEPFRGSRATAADLEIAAAFTQSDLPEGYPGVRGRTVTGAAFFDADIWVAGQRRRTGLELRWRPGRFNFAAEGIELKDDRHGQALDRSDLPPLVTRGWYVSGSWVVAGAPRASNVDNPRHPVFRGGWGSLQLAARREALTFGSLDVPDAPLVIHRAARVPGSQDAATTIGVTWYATRWFRFQANGVYERLRSPSSEPMPPARIWSRLIRVQVVI